MDWDVRGRTCLITGASNGIGRATAHEMAARGARLVLLCRSAERAERVAREIRDAVHGAEVRLLQADLSVQDEVRAAAQEFLAEGQPLHVLINNAGQVNLRHQSTGEGYEMTFAVNHLSMFLFTLLLLDRMRESAPARIVNVSSAAHRWVQRINFADLHRSDKYAPMGAYARSKLANILFTRELARRLEGSGVTANTVHPGAVRSGLFDQDVHPVFQTLLNFMGLFFLSPEKGARNSLYAACDPALAQLNGAYLAKCRVRQPTRAASDDAAAARLWQESLRMTGHTAAEDVPEKPSSV